MTRFFVAIVPPTEIQDSAQAVIRELSDRYQTSTAKAAPHITLQPPFVWLEESLPQLEQQLMAVAQVHAAFPVRLAGFGAFVPRVLYINVLKTPELLTLQAELMVDLERSLGIVDPTAKQRPFAPHLTVASRNMTRSTFKAAWAELQPRSLQLEFVADALTLLIHDGQRWQVRSQYPLSAL
jgi:2'-5' RNA ligase